MSAPRNYNPLGAGDLPHDLRGEEQEELDEKNRRSSLVNILEAVKRQRGTIADVLQLVELLGLEAQLDELAGSRRRHPERHRRLEAARRSHQAAGLEPDGTVGTAE